MNLLPDHAEDIFHGVLDVVQDDTGRFFPRRFTQKQMDYYAPHQGYKYRSGCSASMKIALRTDSPTIELDMDIESGCREYYSLDFEINGHFRPGFLSMTHPNSPAKLKFEINPEGKTADIVIWLNQYRPSYFRAINIEDGCSFEPLPQPQRKLLCFGDSITQGMTSLRPINTYINVLARLMDMRVLNQGVGGHVAEAASVDTALPYKPDLITIAYGTNDWSRQFNHEEITTNVTEYMQAVKTLAPDVPVFWITPLWRNNMWEEKTCGNLLEFTKSIAKAAQENGAVLINGMNLLPHDHYYFFDGLHPNDIGGNIYGANLYKAILPHL